MVRGLNGGRPGGGEPSRVVTVTRAFKAARA
jgi:hypothetical protein